MKQIFRCAGRLLALLTLSGALLAAPLTAQASSGSLRRSLTNRNSSRLELEMTEMELEITDDDPRPKGYLYPSGQSDYYFIVWMSSNSNVATVDGDGKVTGRSAGTAIITAISDRGSRAACKVTVTRQSEADQVKKPALDITSLSLVQKYDDRNPTHQLSLTNSDRSLLYVYQWMSSDPEVAAVSDKGLVTAQKPGSATITALVSNGQALRCSVTVTSEIGKVTLNKNDLLLRTAGAQEKSSRPRWPWKAAAVFPSPGSAAIPAWPRWMSTVWSRPWRMGKPRLPPSRPRAALMCAAWRWGWQRTNMSRRPIWPTNSSSRTRI